MDASLGAPQTKNGPKPIFDAVPLKLWKFNRIWHLAPLSRRQIARQLDRAVADADQTADSAADRLEQAPHFAFATLSQHHPVPAIGAPSGTFVRHLDALERGAPIVELDAPGQFLKILFFKNALHAHGVLPLDFVARVHQAVGELAGIGQQQQARAVDIQPPHRHPPAWRQDRKDGRTSFRVTPGHQPAFGLVIHQDASRLLGEQACSFTVDGDLVCRERTIAKPGGPPGDANPARFDPGLDFAPRAMTGRSQELLQPLASRLSRRFRWRLVPARNRRLPPRRRSPPAARAEGVWRFPLAAAAPPACAAPGRRETCGWWRKAPAGPASRAGLRRRSSRGSPASG